MGPAVVARGTQEAVDYYRVLLAELEQRVKDGVAAIEGEKHRLYWEGMPIWGKLRPLSDLLGIPQDLCRGLHLLQQLDLRSARSRGSL